MAMAMVAHKSSLGLSVSLWAWICPLEVEQMAAMEMLDEHHSSSSIQQSSGDHNVYKLGSINGHNIVIAGLHLPGNCSAAAVVAQMTMTFPNIRCGVLVGIGGGVPVTTDKGMIRLRHVVASKPTGKHSGAVQYDHGKSIAGHFERTGALPYPPTILLNAAQALEVERARAVDDPVWLNIQRIDTEHPQFRRFRFPGAAKDHLYRPEYRRQRPGLSCESFVVVHRGIIASGELVVKDAELRDCLAEQDGLLCFEMEAAGALSGFPCLVIRGISDYCDSHKNDEWQGYAAAAAAAYARQLFYHISRNWPSGGGSS
ncbi:kinesin light chain [Corynascus novoguineensis]|uniref:Kinesin light chain n=1 Tax=Corynascus novoguineensis TaxID=1126955 RepID=A0AAN7CUC7_9PEZI|nr:kinesin light chain [Corynascus novoguineensis]